MLLGGDAVLEALEDASGVPSGETDADGVISVEHVECIGACGGAVAVQVNYELIEGVTPDRARSLVDWLRSAQPATVLGDEMQELFGSRRSFDWGIKEGHGALGPVPAFQPLGTVSTAEDR
jgi:NADH-quinone oxidoreductase subunit E